MAIQPYSDILETNGVKVYYGDAIPTAGSYNAGDILVFTNSSSATPNAPYPAIARCTVAGSPGTWVSIGQSTTFGALLTIASNTIAPTNSCHKIANGTLQTITVPTGWPDGGQLDLIPLVGTTAFIYNTTGNIAGPATGTATQGRVMSFLYNAADTKWYPSY